MLRLAADEDFDGDILRGLRRRLIGLDLVRVQDSGLSGAPDLDVLGWAAGEGRALLTRDEALVGDVILCGQWDWCVRTSMTDWLPPQTRVRVL